MNIDDIDAQHTGNEQRKFRAISAVLWGLVLSSLIALHLNGTNVSDVVDLFSLGGLSVAIGIVILGVAGILFKTLQTIGFTVSVIVRLFYAVGFIAGLALLSAFVL